MSQLTESDWGEIYAAIDSKIAGLVAGEYGESDGDCNVKEWIGQLEGIKDKIGPDGENMTGEVTGEDNSAKLYSTLRAIKARLNGEWDNPDLQRFGALHPNEDVDCMRMVESALTGEIPEPSPVRIVVEVEGGVAQAVYSNLPDSAVDVSVLDRDNREADDTHDKHYASLEDEIGHLNSVY
jgi:hypothetical protein